MAEPPTFESYDPGIAEGMARANRSQTGLPAYLGIEVADVGPGRLVCEIEVRDELLNPFGTMHGGVVAGLVDHVLGAVMYPVMRKGQWAATTEFKLNYLAPVREGRVRAEAQIVALTRRTGVVRVEVTNGERTVCLAQGTCLIADPKPK